MPPSLTANTCFFTDIIVVLYRNTSPTTDANGGATIEDPVNEKAVTMADGDPPPSYTEALESVLSNEYSALCRAYKNAGYTQARLTWISPEFTRDHIACGVMHVKKNGDERGIIVPVRDDEGRPNMVYALIYQDKSGKRYLQCIEDTVIHGRPAFSLPLSTYTMIHDALFGYFDWADTHPVAL